MLPEVSRARVTDALSLHRKKKLSCVEAAELLGEAGQRFRQAVLDGMASGGMSLRQFRRRRDASEAQGAEGIIDRRRGRASRRRAPADAIAGLIEEFRSRTFDFTAKHFHAAVHGARMSDGRLFQRSYSWTKSVLQSPGLTSKAKRRGAHRRKRERRPLPGMRVFQDASTHAWLAEGPQLDLVATMDDATSRILSSFRVEQEGTASSFRGLGLDDPRAGAVRVLLHRSRQPLFLPAKS